MTRILLSAHKGGPEEGYVPNSLAAATAVRDSGVDLIEFDVRITQDDQFVTLHDEAVLVDGVMRPVGQLPAAAVLRYAEGACLLKDMLMAVKDHAVAHVDLKNTRLEVEVVDLCESILGRHGFIITTLEDESVRKIRQARPAVQVALSLGRDTRGLPWLRAMNIRRSEIFPARRVASCQPTMLAVSYKLARFGVLRWAKRHQLPVLLWTMNSPDLIEKAWANPYIWAFTTNYPREALLLSHHHAKQGWIKHSLHPQAVLR